MATKNPKTKAQSGGDFLGRIDTMFKVTAPDAAPVEVPAAVAPSSPPSPFQIQWLSVDEIDMGDLQPRLSMDETELDELIESINSIGLLHAIVVRPNPSRPSRKLIMAGHRRLQAVRKGANAAPPATENRGLWLHKIPAVVFPENLTPVEILTIAMEENTTRSDLNALERGLGYERLHSMFCEVLGYKVTWPEIGKKTGLSYRQMKRYRDLAEMVKSLPPDLQNKVKAKFGAKEKEDRWTERHGRAIIDLGDAPRQRDILVRQMLNEDLTATKAEQRAKAIRAAEPTESDLRLRDAMGRELQRIQQQSAEKTAEANRANLEQGRAHLSIVRDSEVTGEPAGERSAPTPKQEPKDTYVQGYYTPEMVKDLHLDPSHIGKPIPRLYDPNAPEKPEPVATEVKSDKPTRADVATELASINKRLNELRTIATQAEADDFGNGEIAAEAKKLGFIATALANEFGTRG
jgi:ParB/RepB/Spo0J family partition protein